MSSKVLSKLALKWASFINAEMTSLGSHKGFESSEKCAKHGSATVITITENLMDHVLRL